MSRTALLAVLSVYLAPGLAAGQQRPTQIDPAKVPAPQMHYQAEYTFDTPGDSLRWSKQPSGLNVSFGSTDESYMRSEAPDLPRGGASRLWEGTGWKGERLNAQLVIWSPDTVNQIRITTSDLVNAQGAVLSKSNLQVHLVRYVLSNYPYGATPRGCDASDTVFLMPDRLEALERFDLPARTVRPVWVSLDIPPGTAAGIYQGTIDVSSEKSRASLQVRIRVQNQVLPSARDWKFRLDLWQNPWVVAWYYHLRPWSDEHKALLKKHLQLYAEAGGKYITTYAVYSPWADNSYMIEGAMIDWTKRADGTWKFDYDIFDQYVQLAMDVGVDKAITIYTPVPWGHRFRYLDAKTGNYVYEEWSPDSAKFRAMFPVFLDDLKAHLEQKGWFNRTYLGINENPMPITLAAIKVIKDHSRAWRITYAGDWHPELDSLLDDYSPAISSEPSPPEVRQRSARGATTTYYVACFPARPNNFVFSPPIEGRYVGWHAAAYGYDGFLRWAYDAWPADPVRDARHAIWPAGDTFLVYPGANSSIRFEKLREGIVDYEKLQILRALASRSANGEVQRQLRALDDHLRTFVGDPDYGKRDYGVARLTEAVHKGMRMLEALSERLAQ